MSVIACISQDQLCKDRQLAKNYLLERMAISDSCWNWSGRCVKPGKVNGRTFLEYGFTDWLSDKRKRFYSGIKYAHRLAWFAFNGPIPEGVKVLHKCDNPKCCNPHHLFLGTQLQNVKDCRAKNRLARGEQHSRAKLTNESVRMIRKLHESGCFKYAQLSRMFCVSGQLIRDVVRRERWKHVD